jgi:hypothetical protein
MEPLLQVVVAVVLETTTEHLVTAVLVSSLFDTTSYLSRRLFRVVQPLQNLVTTRFTRLPHLERLAGNHGTFCTSRFIWHCSTGN